MTAADSTDDVLAAIDEAVSGYITRDDTVGPDAMRSAPAPVAESSGFGEVIHAYTRANAIADGVLVEVPSGIAREAGFAVPVALTCAVWEDCVAWSDADAEITGAYQDQQGRLWDVLTMVSWAIRCNSSGDTAVTQVARIPRGERFIEDADVPQVYLEIKIGPGDDGEPVLTVMQPGED